MNDTFYTFFQMVAYIVIIASTFGAVLAGLDVYGIGPLGKKGCGDERD